MRPSFVGVRSDSKNLNDIRNNVGCITFLLGGVLLLMGAIILQLNRIATLLAN